MSDALKAEKQFSRDVKAHRVVAILRHMPPEKAESIFQILAAAGIRLVEITMNSRGAARQIQAMRQAFGSQLIIGAGTVTTPQRAREAIEAGAAFLVTPNLNLDVIGVAHEAGVPIVPGVMTPTEMMAAADAGVKTLKLFPASVLGCDYVKAVKAPLDDVQLIAVGGITAQNAADFIRAGCMGVGMGSSLLDFDKVRSESQESVIQELKALQATIRP